MKPEEVVTPLPPIRILSPQQSSKDKKSLWQDRESTLLGKDINSGEEVWISQKERRSSMYILGSTGSGKSVLISHMCAQDMRQKIRLSDEDDRKIGLCVIAPDSDLIHAILARVPADREQDVILLDVIELAKQGQFFGLNLFYCPHPSDITEFELTVEQVHGVFEKVFHMSSETTPRLEEYVHAITRTFIGTPYTMTEIAPLLLNDAFRKTVVHPSSDFWQEYDAMKPHERREEYRSTFTRIRNLTDNQILRYTVGQSSLFDFSQAINRGKIVLVRLPGEYGDLGKLLGSILIGQLLRAALQQNNLSRNKRPYFNLYIDEFQDFATPAINKLLVQARKFHIGTTVAHQSLYQDGMTDEIRATTRNVGSMVFFRLTNTDQKDIASVFDITPPVAKKPDPILPGNVLDELYRHPDEPMRRFYARYVRRWQVASGKTLKEYHDSSFSVLPSFSVETEYDFPRADLGAGVVEYDPDHISNALLVMNDLFYETQREEEVNRTLYTKLIRLVSRYLDADFLTALGEVLGILTLPDGKIQVPSTQWQDTPLSQRTFGDREHEIGNKLGHLPNGQAMVRLSTGEHLIETAPYSRMPDITGKKERILKQTIKNYCKPQAEIEREIAKRVPRPQPPTQRKGGI